MTANFIQGAGIGFRDSHFEDIFQFEHKTPWFELLTENHLIEESLPFFKAEKIREHYPVTLHGVGMSLGSTDPINYNYLKQLKTLIKRLDPVYVSDHLAWVSHNGIFSHALRNTGDWQRHRPTCCLFRRILTSRDVAAF